MVWQDAPWTSWPPAAGRWPSSWCWLTRPQNIQLYSDILGMTAGRESGPADSAGKYSPSGPAVVRPWSRPRLSHWTEAGGLVSAAWRGNGKTRSGDRVSAECCGLRSGSGVPPVWRVPAEGGEAWTASACTSSVARMGRRRWMRRREWGGPPALERTLSPANWRGMTSSSEDSL